MINCSKTEYVKKFLAQLSSFELIKKLIKIVKYHLFYFSYVKFSFFALSFLLRYEPIQGNYCLFWYQRFFLHEH